MYNIILTIHIFSAGIWLSNFIFSLIISNQIRKTLLGNSTLLNFYLQYSNILGMIGSISILFTGIFMVLYSSQFTFFEMKANHWLTSKQILMVVILFITFLMLIPKAKRLKKSVSENSVESEKEFNSFNKINTILNILVLINFLFGLSRWLIY